MSWSTAARPNSAAGLFRVADLARQGLADGADVLEVVAGGLVVGLGGGGEQHDRLGMGLAEAG